MRAVVCPGAGEPLQIATIETPRPKSGEVLIKVHACGVCHTDVHLARGGLALAKFPRVLGHEVTGVITATGAGVPKTMVGARVGMPWTFSACGQCRECLRGDEVLCAKTRITGVTVDGGYAEYMIAPAAYVTTIPEALGFAEAAPLFCAGLTTYKALKVGEIEPGKRVAIIGIGGLGHLAIQFARYMGAEVMAVTGTPEKEHLARELGAHYTVNAREQDVVRELNYVGGADLILTTIWDSREIERLLAGLAPDGTLVMAGVPRDPISVRAELLVQGRRRIMASPSGSRRDLRDMLDFCVLHHVRPLIETFPLDQAAEAHRRVHDNLPRFRDVLVTGA